jgi:hypothetical protein
VSALGHPYVKAPADGRIAVEDGLLKMEEEPDLRFAEWPTNVEERWKDT